MKAETLQDIELHVVSMLDIVSGLDSKLNVEAPDDTLNEVLAYNMMILGESANRIPKRFQDEFSDIPWARIIGLRNVLIHDYLETNFDVLWKIKEDHIGALLPLLEGLLAHIKDFQKDGT